MFKKILSILRLIKNFSLKHKIISGAIIIIIIIASFFIFKSLGGTTAQAKYVLFKAEKGTIVSSISSSGQVLAQNQIDVKGKASGTVVYVGAKDGQGVSSGQLLAQIDSSSAQKAVNDAQTNLEQAQLDLEKMQGLTTDTGTLRGNKEKADDTLKKAYDDGFNAIADAFIDLPNIITGLHDIIYGNTFNNYQPNIDYYTSSAYTYDERALQYKSSVENSYKTAKAAYDKNFDAYKTTSRFSDNATIDSLISQTYETTKDIAQSIKDANNLIQFYKDALTTKNITTSSTADTQLSSLNSYLGQVNSHLSSLYSAQTTIQSDKEAVVNVGFDVQDQQIKIKQLENSLANAKETLSNYYVRAPFSGVIAAMNAQVGDTVPSTVATLITKNLVAEISFGETDIAKIKIGQKATLTFDAVADLTITGQVSAIDIIGTSSQGVVSYTVKVLLDIQDERIKPGMSTTATIITNTKTDALYVPNSAVKTQQGTFYVLKVTDTISEQDLQNTSGVVLKNSPTRQTVETGLSDDTSTEITSGLSEGDIVVSSTVSSTSATKNAATSNNSRNANFRGIPGL